MAVRAAQSPRPQGAVAGIGLRSPSPQPIREAWRNSRRTRFPREAEGRRVPIAGRAALKRRMRMRWRRPRLPDPKSPVAGARRDRRVPIGVVGIRDRRHAPRTASMPNRQRIRPNPECGAGALQEKSRCMLSIVRRASRDRRSSSALGRLRPHRSILAMTPSIVSAGDGAISIRRGSVPAVSRFTSASIFARRRPPGKGRSARIREPRAGRSCRGACPSPNR